MQTIVGVLRGGPSHEHDISLKTGAAMLANLPEDRFTTRDIYIDRNGVWHAGGRPTSPDRILHQLDVVLNGLHGEYGEDGEVQKLLDRFGVRYTGTDHLGSYLAMHKALSKAYARDAGLLTPEFRLIERPEDIEKGVSDAIRTFHQPVVVKPVNWGSSVGVSMQSGYAPALKAVRSLFEEGAPGVLVEEHVKGTEASVSVLENFRSERLYALPTVEVMPPKGDFYSYSAKYAGGSQYRCPGKFSRVDNEELAHAARVMHRTLGLRHYSRSDFLVTPKGIYYLETNTLPGLVPGSHLPMALAAVGVRLPEFLEHLIKLART